MDAIDRRSTGWILVVAGAAGMILALATLPTVWAVVSGQARYGWTVEVSLPQWAQWHVLSLTGAHLALGALLCGLLLAAGRLPARLLAVACLLWFVAATAALSSGSYWFTWMATKGDGTPLAVQVMGHGIVLVVLSVAAFLTARERSRRTAVASEPRDMDAGAGSG